MLAVTGNIIDYGDGTSVEVSIGTAVRNRTFRASSVTDHLKNGGTLEKSTSHSSTRTTQRYEHRSDDISLGEVERVLIQNNETSRL